MLPRRRSRWTPAAWKRAGSASRWGPLFGARAHDWDETWEGPGGCGTPVYEHVLGGSGVDRARLWLRCGPEDDEVVSLPASYRVVLARAIGAS